MNTITAERARLIARLAELQKSRQQLVLLWRRSGLTTAPVEISIIDWEIGTTEAELDYLANGLPF